MNCTFSSCIYLFTIQRSCDQTHFYSHEPNLDFKIAVHRFLLCFFFIFNDGLNIFNALKNETSFAMFPESYFYNKRPGKKKKKKKKKSQNTKNYFKKL